MTPAPSTGAWLRDTLREGQVIPAHPLALTAQRRLDERRQRALTRYYHASGGGGIAVGVHTTQFAIRDAKHGLLQPVLELAARTVRECDERAGRKTVCIAGICGPTRQAVREAELAAGFGYHAGLLSLAALPQATDKELVAHCRAVAEVLPVVGFYLQPAAGGRLLSAAFWREFVEVANVVAIKIAPFNRYQTLDVLRAVAESGRASDLALYTGNDDNIVVDLLTEYVMRDEAGTGERRLRMAGGLLGHWACWTRRAVELLQEIKQCRRLGQNSKRDVSSHSWLSRAVEITDANAALFDASHGFAGCIAGIHEVLRRQGLLAGLWCLDPKETLSPGQAEAINRIQRLYPHLGDDEFVAAGLDSWLAN